LDESKNWLNKNGDTATTNDFIQKRNELKENVCPVLDKYAQDEKEVPENESEERKKLKNLTQNIQLELSNNKQLQNLDEDKKNKIYDIAKNAEEWLKNNKNATNKDLKDYISSMWKLLGDQTNFKFSVWVVANYGIGYNFTEQTKWGKNSGLAKDYSQYATTFLKKGNSDFKGYQGYKGKNFDNVSKIPKNISKEEKESLEMLDKLKQTKGDFKNDENNLSLKNSTSKNPTYSLDELKNMSNVKNKEKLLSDDDFNSLFKMSKKEFERIPIFQQHSLKKKFGIY
jgi:hypothetical protein